MGTLEFGGLVWLPYAVLGLLLTIGYVVFRLHQSRAGKSLGAEKHRRASALDEELQRAIEEAERQKSARNPVGTPDNTLPQNGGETADDAASTKRGES